jgi:hypothetical protein
MDRWVELYVQLMGEPQALVEFMVHAWQRAALCGDVALQGQLARGSHSILGVCQLLDLHRHPPGKSVVRWFAHRNDDFKPGQMSPYST